MISYNCKHCQAEYKDGNVMDLVNHQLYKHQKLMLPSEAIEQYRIIQN